MKFGFLAFGASLVATWLRKRKRGAAYRRYPEVAKRLGIAYEQVDGLELGRLRGPKGGMDILVVPEEGRIALRLKQPLAICFRNYTHYKRTPPGREPFSFGVRWADKWVHNRFCDVGMADELHRDSDLVDCLQALRRFHEQLKQLSVDEDRVECVLDFGKPPFIPAAATEAIVPLLLDLAQHCSTLAPELSAANGTEPVDPLKSADAS